MILAWKLFGWFRTSLISQILVGLVAFAGIWKVNNIMVANKAIKEVKEEAVKDGHKRNAKANQIRRRPLSADRKRLREYIGSDQ